MYQKKIITKNIKLTPDDVWRNTSFIVSLKMMDPQFAGQTKTKLQSAHILSILTPKLKDSFEIWFNQHSETAQSIAALIISNAEQRVNANLSSARKIIELHCYLADYLIV